MVERRGKPSGDDEKRPDRGLHTVRDATGPTDRPSRGDARGAGIGPKRRHVLQALGAGVGVSALAGPGGTASGEGTRATRRDGTTTGGVDPMYGFAAASPEVEPPVEPDQEVQMLIRPREDRDVPDFYFEPTGLFIEPGDTVKFNGATPGHNVAAYHPAFSYHQRIPDGVPPFSSPMIVPGGYWLYTFERPGVYEMRCAPHELNGMVMRLVVGDVSGPAAKPLFDLCGDVEAPETTGEGGLTEVEGLPMLAGYTVLRDPALDPKRIKDVGRVNWDDLAPGSKRSFVEVVDFPPCGG